jgi:predicted dienelactone hydrolase
MKTHLLLVAFLVGCQSVPSGGVPVGTFTKSLTDTTRNRDVTAEIWFEVDNADNVVAFSARPPIKAIPIAINATPKDVTTPRPVIFISHGNWGTRYSQGWLALELVNAGYVVVSLSHPGTMADDRTSAGATMLWDRAKDASAVLDALLADAQWSKLIDPNRIGFVGHSFGAHTGVLLAGGVFDPEVQFEFCRHNQHDFYCKGSNEVDLSTINLADAKQNHADPRFTAFYLMAPGPAQGFSLASLQQVQAPVAVDVARFDDILIPSENADVFATTIKGAWRVERPVGHFTYVPECKPLLGMLLASQICGDPSGVDRAQAHADMARDVISFMAKSWTTATVQP